MIYLDTSALVKLVRREQESDGLADWLDEQGSIPWVSSALIEVELPRALRRSDPRLIADAPALVARVARYEIDDVVRAAAAAYPDPDFDPWTRFIWRRRRPFSGTHSPRSSPTTSACWLPPRTRALRLNVQVARR